ncbi:MAG: hypothetical protein FWH35_02695, partial [Treponema sp.]|nr:hypothetical protein [Treponema sp.]
ECEDRSRFFEAVPLAIDRAALLHGPTLAANRNNYSALFADPYSSLMDRIFNYGANLLRLGREEDCLLWAVYASPVFPDLKRWQDFIYAAVNNRLNKYFRAGQIADAAIFLENQKPLLDSGSYAKFETLVIDTDLINRAGLISNVAEGEAVAARIDEERRANKINSMRANELLNFAVQKTAQIISAAPGSGGEPRLGSAAGSGGRDWLGAVKYIENAIARFGTNSELEKALAAYRSNLSSDFHNQFAAAYNNGNYEEARLILEQGLAELPGDRRLISDMAALNKIRN